MKISAFILSIILLFSCFKGFEVVEATSQSWAGGRPETGNGTNYKFTLVAKAGSDKLSFENVWINGRAFEVTAYKDLRHRNETGFEKNDTIYLFVEHVKRLDMQHLEQTGEHRETESGSAGTPPQTYEGAALIEYTLRGKTKYETVEKFKELPRQNRP